MKLSLNIDQRYGRLFTVQFRHDYYAHKNCYEMGIAPTADTEQLMRQLGLLFRTKESECFIGYQDGELLQLMLGTLKEPIKFSFVLYSKENYFSNYTELPFKEEEEIFHFSNWSKNESQNNVQDKKISLEKSQLIPIYPPIFDYQLQNQKEADIQIKNEQGQEISFPPTPVRKRKNESPKEAATSTKGIRIDLSNEPSGKYTLHVKGALQTTFYLAQTQQQRPFGFIDIHAESKDEALNLSNPEELLAPTFQINFKARAIRWKYLLPKNEGNDYTDFTVEDEQNEVHFHPAKEVQIRDGRTFNAIYSKELLPFSQVPPGPLYLKYRKKNGKALPIKRAIPAPSFERIVPEGEQNTFCAELFIYV